MGTSESGKWFALNEGNIRAIQMEYRGKLLGQGGRWQVPPADRISYGSYRYGSLNGESMKELFDTVREWNLDELASPEGVEGLYDYMQDIVADGEEPRLCWIEAGGGKKTFWTSMKPEHAWCALSSMSECLADLKAIKSCGAAVVLWVGGRKREEVKIRK